MPANFFQGRMAFVGEVPWHGLGNRVPDPVGAAEMIKAAGLAWEVELRPLQERGSLMRMRVRATAT